MVEKIKSIFNEFYGLVYEGKQLIELDTEGVRAESYIKKLNRQKELFEQKIHNFIKVIPVSAGENWLREYTLYQFYYHKNDRPALVMKYFLMIYNEKSVTAYKNRTEDQIFHANKYRVKIGVKRQFEPLSSTEYKNAERVRFQDNNRQFLHCAELYLFEKRNAVCKACDLYFICNNKIKDGL